jgi:hypothetical protein
MQRTIWKAAFLLLALGLVVGKLNDLRPVKAQSSCFAGSLIGSYTYVFNGSYFDNNNNQFGYSSSGHLIADGNGHFSGSETTDDGATIYQNDTVTGTYSINADCSGSATFNLAQDNPLNVDLNLTNNGRMINLIETDDGTQVVGTAQPQFPSN